MLNPCVRTRQETNDLEDKNSLSQKEKVFGSQRQCAHTIQCECGIDIAVVSDLMVMSKAIETHVEEHLKGITDPTLAAREADRLWDLLTAALFDYILIET